MAEPIEVTEPGVYDIPEDAYHRDPVPDGSLSASAAKKLLTDGGPARYRYQLEHPEPSSEAMELGTAAHKLVLGVGQELHEVKADRTGRPRMPPGRTRRRKLARKAGKIPLSWHVQVAHRPRDGRPAAALRAARRGAAQRRARPPRGVRVLDRRAVRPLAPLPVRPHARPQARRAHPRHRRLQDLRQCRQASAASPRRSPTSATTFSPSGTATATRPSTASGPSSCSSPRRRRRPTWSPPYHYRLDAEALAIGADAMARAMEIWRDCREAEAAERAHAWPGYSHEIETIALPRWSRAREDFYA